MNETDLFKPVKDFLIEQGYESIYTEVPLARRPDIVATRGNMVTVIELKTTFSIAVMEQVFEWTTSSLTPNYIYIAVPKPKKKSLFREKICRDYGFGILYINNGRVYKRVEAKLIRNRCTKKDWKKYLLDDFLYKNNGKAGRAGSYKTFWNVMIDNIVKKMEYLAKPNSWDRTEPKKWFTVNDLADLPAVKNHYCNPKASLYHSLSNLCSEDKIFTKKMIGRRVHFGLKEEYEKDLVELFGYTDDIIL